MTTRSLDEFRKYVRAALDEAPIDGSTAHELEDYHELSQDTARRLLGMYAHTFNVLTKAVFEARFGLEIKTGE